MNPIEIEIGNGIRAGDFIGVLQDLKCNISDTAKEMIGNFSHTTKFARRTYEVVFMSGEELGFDKPVSREEICARAEEFSLELCFDEMGPQLRIQWIDQPVHSSVLMAMEPVLDAQGYPQIFTVGRGDEECGKWLSAVSGQDDCLWAPLYIWAFIQC